MLTQPCYTHTHTHTQTQTDRQTDTHTHTHTQFLQQDYNTEIFIPIFQIRKLMLLDVRQFAQSCPSRE